MHRAAHYLEGCLPPQAKKAIVEAYVLTPADAASVTAALPVDANNYFYSASLSVLDGLRAIDLGFYTWSTVKMYYSVFYACRAIMAWDNVAIFWPADAPFKASGVAGASPQWVSGKGTHKAILNCFRQLRPTDPMLSQPVGTATDGLQWLLAKREQANYLIPRFSEPEVPPHYERIVDLGVRRATVAYLETPPNLLTFDEDHAVASFPLAMLKVAGDAAIAHGGAILDSDELAFLVKKCQERRGALTPLLTYIRQTLAN